MAFSAVSHQLIGAAAGSGAHLLLKEQPPGHFLLVLLLRLSEDKVKRKKTTVGTKTESLYEAPDFTHHHPSWSQRSR